MGYNTCCMNEFAPGSHLIEGRDMHRRLKPFETNQLISRLDDDFRSTKGTEGTRLQKFRDNCEYLERDNNVALVGRRIDAITFRKIDDENFHTALKQEMPNIRDEWLRILNEYSSHVDLRYKGKPMDLKTVLRSDPHFLKSLANEKLAELIPEFDDDEVEEQLLGHIYERLSAIELRGKYADNTIAPPPGTEPSAIITRISPDDYGVFDQIGRLQSVFKKGDKENVSFVEALKGRNALVGKNAKEAAENVATIMDLRVREHLEKDYGFSLADLTLREQASLLNTLASIDREEDNRQTDFMNTFGLPGAKSFLACEYGSELRSTILEIGEKMPEDQAEKIFTAYAEIASLAQETADELAKRFFTDPEEKTFNADKVRNELLARAKDLLVKARSEPDIDVLIASLERSRADVLLFKAMFKNAKRANPEMSFEDIKGVTVETLPIQGIEPDQKQKLLAIFEGNWKKNPAECARFRAKLAQPDAQLLFYLLKKDEAIVGFVSFEKNSAEAPNGVYADHFNVSSKFSGESIGQTFLELALNAEAETETLYAHADPSALVASHYVENGWVITGFDDGWLKIQYDKSTNHGRRGRDTPQGEMQHISIDNFKHITQDLERRGSIITRLLIDPFNREMRYVFVEPVEIVAGSLAA